MKRPEKKDYLSTNQIHADELHQKYVKDLEEYVEYLTKSSLSMNGENISYQVSSYDFQKGIQVSNGDMLKWHREILESLKNGHTSSHIIGSGNGICVGVRCKNDSTIIICEVLSGYIKHTYMPVK